MTAILKTPLNRAIKELGGKMVTYAGYEMPVRFGSIKAEHQAVRQTAGLFDVSHMTEFWIEGNDAQTVVNSLLTNNVSKIESGQMQYSLMLTEQGTVVDDLMVYKFSNKKILLVMNAACKEQDLNHLNKYIVGDVKLIDRSIETAQLALQGPNAKHILGAITDEFNNLEFLHFKEGTLLDVPVLVSRSGYTGEDGYEIYCPNQGAQAVFNALMEKGKAHGLLPVGLGARDTLRLEAKLPLYGNELGFNITPLEARLKWAIDFDKEMFIGKQPLVDQLNNGLSKKLIGFEMLEKAIPRHGYKVVNEEGIEIGEVTSGCPSPTLEKNIGLAFVPAKGFKVGSEIEIDIRGKRKRAKIIKTPFYRRPQ